jgi:hypothetical protein
LISWFEGRDIAVVEHSIDGQEQVILVVLTNVGGMTSEESIAVRRRTEGFGLEPIKGFSEISIVGEKLVGIPSGEPTVAAQIPLQSEGSE